ncbi:MAG TPA: hypothetical protein VFD32_01065, partial [Dehalococcoidia bacterium]|nr:hypothetical protein [Dehalococcoidia bacterium]
MRSRALALLGAALFATSALACSSNNNAANGGTATNQNAGTQQPAARPLVAGTPVDGIPCETTEQLTYHVHAHLTVIANGQNVPVPAFIGIPGRCIYWLHTHDT